MDEREEYLVNRIKKLEGQLEQADAGTKEIGTLVDALMIHMAMEFGVKEPSGYRVKLPVFIARDLVNRYQLSVEKDDFEYVLRVSRREA